MLSLQGYQITFQLIDALHLIARRAWTVVLAAVRVVRLAAVAADDGIVAHDLSSALSSTWYSSAMLRSMPLMHFCTS